MSDDDELIGENEAEDEAELTFADDTVQIEKPPEEEIADIDRDSLYILPLSMLPIQTPALRRARLIKNVRLDSVVELFQDVGSGSGQIDVEGLPTEFSWPEAPPHPDLLMLRNLARLPSYDVYSLRILLREQGIDVNDVEALKLSENKMRELTSYMTTFTRPLIMQIYGDDDMNITDFEDIIALFRDPDVKKALEKLKVMAEKLEIELGDIPVFLEDYGHIFLSLSYYRAGLDSIKPIIDQFIYSMDDMRKNWQLSQDPNMMRACDLMERTTKGLLLKLTERFENFDKSSETMWDNLNATRFRKVERMIQSYHTTIGGVLCALTVKMEAWNRIFPDEDSGGPIKRGEFMLSELKQGLDKIKLIEKRAPPMPADIFDDDDDLLAK